MYLPIWRPLIGRTCVCLPVGLLLRQIWTRLFGSGLLAELGPAYLEACCQLIPALLIWRPQDTPFPYSRWKQSCTTWEHHALDPRVPILILASSFWAELLGFGWKESCTTPHSSTLNSGTQGASINTQGSYSCSGGGAGLFPSTVSESSLVQRWLVISWILD